ncbi:MAG: polysaccharide deacetylase family protein [Usitatibacter sp.]
MSRATAVPVLTWHAMNVNAAGYAGNEHVAFREDLETLHRLGMKVVPLADIVVALVSGSLETLQGCVGLSLDDGSDFDFHDLPHPRWGTQRSMANILADFRARHGAEAQPRLHATSFAIVSPEARRILDRTCMIGCGWWNDSWWRDAEAGGLISVESHGWDHNHESLPATVASAPRGKFNITTRADADAEIAQASQLLKKIRGRDGEVLFAYPYGVANDFLAEDYFPSAVGTHGVSAAFTTEPGPVAPDTSRWRIPRWVSGWHWKSGAELERLLADAGCVPRRDEPAKAASHASWRECLRTWEVNDARAVAGDLFRRCFHHEVPNYPRHFVLVYSPPPGSAESEPRVVAYVHQRPFENVYLCGGMCVDERFYRRMPKWLFDEVRREGGLATIVTRDSMGMLAPSPASFGHVGEPRARAADLRTGFIDTGLPHLMVMWLKPISEEEKARLVRRVAAIGPF